MRKCDKYIFMGDEDIPELPMMKVEFEGPATYVNMWRKSLAMWQYVHANLLDDFDFFYTAGDDVFMFVENLRKFLLSAKVVAEVAKQKGVYIGHRTEKSKSRWADPLVFNAGGPGYVLDRVAVGLVVEGYREEDAKKGQPQPVTPVEDVKVGEVLKKAGVFPMHTEDGVSQRFHLFAPEFYLSFDPNSEKDKDGWVTKGERNLNPPFVAGQAGVSNESIAFHYCDLLCLWELGRLAACKEEHQRMREEGRMRVGPRPGHRRQGRGGAK
jgi:hypothetical protein